MYNFYREEQPCVTCAPEIQVTLTISSSGTDTLEDKAVVASWLTKLTSPWEAQLTYLFALGEKDAAACADELKKPHEGQSHCDYCDEVLERYLPKFVGRVYGGNLDARLVADPEYLGQFEYQFLDAIRDAESELRSGSNPLLKQMLSSVKDIEKDPVETAKLQRDFRKLAGELGQNIRGRVSTRSYLLWSTRQVQ